MSTQKPIPLENLPPGSFSPEEHHRIEAFKQQKEVERLERELAVWQNASKPIRTFGFDELDSSGDEVKEPKAQKSESGFFAKLRLGKFLG
jgi:hypothetical protein